MLLGSSGSPRKASAEGAGICSQEQDLHIEGGVSASQEIRWMRPQSPEELLKTQSHCHGLRQFTKVLSGCLLQCWKLLPLQGVSVCKWPPSHSLTPLPGRPLLLLTLSPLLVVWTSCLSLSIPFLKGSGHMLDFPRSSS